MSNVQQVIVQIKKPKGDFPGQVVYGYFTLDNTFFLTMTDKHGKPAGDETGQRYSHKLQPGEDARAIACKNDQGIAVGVKRQL